MFIVIFHDSLKTEFYNQNIIYYQDLKISINKEIKINEMTFKLSRKIVSYKKYDIFISNNNLKKYEYYQKIDYLQIGNTNNSTIILRGLKEKIEIENQFLKTNNEYCFINNRKVKSGNIANYQLIEILDLKIMLCPDFIVVNRKIPNLLPFTTNNLVTNYNRKIDLKPKFRYQVNKPILKMKLKELKLLTLPENNDVLSSFPQIMMALASLTIGVFMSLNYRSEKNSIYFIYLILPITMLLTVIVVQPLQKYLKTKRINQRNELMIKDYFEYLNSIEKIVTTKLETYKTYLNSRYVDSSCLADYKMIYFKEVFHDDYLFLAFGIGTVNTGFIVEGDHSNKFVKKKIELLKSYSSIIKNSILELNILNYNYISIVGNNNYFEYLVSQVIMYYRPNQFDLILLCEKEYLEHHNYLKRIPHLINAKSRLIACTVDDIKEIELEVKNNNRDKIVIVYNQLLMKYLNTEYHYLINCNEENIYVKSEVVVDYNTNNFILNNELIKFSYQNSKCNLNNVVDKINNYQIGNRAQMSIKNNIYDLLSIKNIKNSKRDIYHHQLQAIIGNSNDGDDISLDIAYNSQGPHGILAGTTGSGKTELLVSYLLILSLKYSCRNLNFIIIDFKGEGIMSNLRYNGLILPHVINNLSNIDEAKIDKALLSFKIEAKKRMKLFKKMSELTNEGSMNLSLYQKLFQTEFNLPYLANLLIVIDEFAELKRYKPDFIDEVISLARIGRSLGIHLLLATQKVSGVINEEILANISYRICMKLNDKSESNTLIESDAAYKLQNPGEFILYHNGEIEKGRGVLANVTTNTQELQNAVYLCDYRLHQLKKGIKKSRNTIKQSNEIVKYLADIEVNQNPSLWKADLIGQSFNSINIKYGMKNELVIGEYDDIELSIQNPLILNPTSNYLLFSLDYKIKNRFIENYLNVSTHLKIKIFYIDISFKKKIKNVDFITKNENDIEMLFHYLDNKDDDDMIVVLIDNITLFNNCNSFYAEKIISYLQDGNYKKFSFFLFANSYQDVYYKFINLIPNRITLNNFNKSDLINIFDKQYKYNYLEGLMFSDKFYSFKLLEKVNPNSLYNFGNNILKIETELKFTIKNKTILLGFSLNTYQKVWFPIGATLLITSFDKKLLINYKNNFNFTGIVLKVANELNASDLQFDYVLFLKGGLKNQFVFDSNNEVKYDDEAILIHDMVYERIKYVKC